VITRAVSVSAPFTTNGWNISQFIMNGDNAEERIHHSDQPDHKSDDTLSVKIIRCV